MHFPALILFVIPYYFNLVLVSCVKRVLPRSVQDWEAVADIFNSQAAKIRSRNEPIGPDRPYKGLMDKWKSIQTVPTGGNKWSSFQVVVRSIQEKINARTHSRNVFDEDKTRTALSHFPRLIWFICY